MSQKVQSGQQSNQADLLPEAPNNTQDETQDPSPITHRPRVSAQDSPPIIHACPVSIQEPPPLIHIHRVSFRETPPISNWTSVQDKPSVTYNSHFDTGNVSPGFQTCCFSAQSPSLVTHIPLTNTESVACTSQVSFQDYPPTTQSLCSSIQGSKLPPRAKVDVLPSVTHSPTASIQSIESTLWNSQENFKDSLHSFQFKKSTLDTIYSLPPGSSMETSSRGFRDECKHRQVRLPVDRWLLYEAKKTSHQLSLVLSLAGMMLISLISLGQPWIHFQVPLTPPKDPAGPLTIPIHTVLFVPCNDISCLQEHDHDAYLLDCACAFFLIASITSFCLCIILINIIFLTSSNLPILDLCTIISSILTGTHMIFGILLYLMQAHEYLQEGMTYRLGCSFYLAWTGIFLFLMSGFFSYLNYTNFWFILAQEAIWT